MKRLAIPLSNQKTVAKWLVIPQPLSRERERGVSITRWREKSPLSLAGR